MRPAHETPVRVTGMEQLLMCVFLVPTYTPTHESAQHVLSTGLTMSILRREFCSRGFSSVSVLLVRRLSRSQEMTKTHHSQHLWNEWRQREGWSGAERVGMPVLFRGQHMSRAQWPPDFLQPSKIHIACQEITVAAENNKLVIDWQVIYIYLYHRTIWCLLVEILWVC